jgi:hypothetical protein
MYKIKMFNNTFLITNNNIIMETLTIILISIKEIVIYNEYSISIIYILNK